MPAPDLLAPSDNGGWAVNDRPTRASGEKFLAGLARRKIRGKVEGMKRRTFFHLSWPGVFFAGGCAHRDPAPRATGAGISLVVDRVRFPQATLALVNLTEAPVRIMDDGCSWGCAALRVEIRSGGKILQGRRMREYTVNFPVYQTIPPGRWRRFYLNMTDAEWEYPPGPRREAVTGRRMMRWVYETVEAGGIAPGDAVTRIHAATPWIEIG